VEFHYKIRDADSSDLDSIVEFTVREAREAEGLDVSRTAAERGVAAALGDRTLATYWLAECDGAVVASVSVVKEWSNFRGGHYWWIQSLFIVPEHRGTGLVERLLDHVLEAARTDGALDVRLYAHSANERALSAYRRYGFTTAPYVMLTRRL
jgi:ribosomal protein S18 acetylase RimI-like enzyme